MCRGKRGYCFVGFRGFSCMVNFREFFFFSKCEFDDIIMGFFFFSKYESDDVIMGCGIYWKESKNFLRELMFVFCWDFVMFYFYYGRFY